MSGKIYITYNSSNKSQIEESTALRLQTLSNLYGVNVLLPYRANLKFELDSESKIRIKSADYIIVLSLTSLSTRLKAEIEFAIKLNKPIIVVYDKDQGKNIKFLNKTKIKEVQLDAYNSEETLSNITKYILKEFKPKPALKKVQSSTVQKNSIIKQVRSEKTASGIALLGIGLGLLSLALLSNDEK